MISTFASSLNVQLRKKQNQKKGSIILKINREYTLIELFSISCGLETVRVDINVGKKIRNCPRIFLPTYLRKSSSRLVRYIVIHVLKNICLKKAVFHFNANYKFYISRRFQKRQVVSRSCMLVDRILNGKCLLWEKKLKAYAQLTIF